MPPPVGPGRGSCLGWAGGGKETRLTAPFVIVIFSWTLGYNCLSLNYLYFNFRGSLMREEGESGARSAISPHPSFLSFALQRGWVCSSPLTEKERALVLRSPGGNRGLQAGRGHSGRGDSCSQS